tara:strand:+ start:442 stop:828 length:387 start_codon:yes stop_codon:yes gene_type:complete
MGRYYHGDIEGKFWFGIQSSTDAEFFGAEGYRPNELNYYFSEEDLKKVTHKIKICEKELGKDLGRLAKFFKEHHMYNDDRLMKHWIDEYDDYSFDVKDKLEWYARHILGVKIRKCIEDFGSCSFTAEL